MTDFTLTCDFPNGDTFEALFVGYEDLSDVLGDIARLSADALIPDVMFDDLTGWSVIADNGEEFAIACPY